MGWGAVPLCCAPPQGELMTKIRNITTDDLGYKGQTFPAGKVVDVPTVQAKSMVEAMPDRFRLARNSSNRSMQDKDAENRMVT